VNERERQLAKLLQGDVFHAASATSDASLICLVVDVSESRIKARVATTQEELCFNRLTGEEEPTVSQQPYFIDSVSPLSVHLYSVVLGIDRKFRLEAKTERLKLNDDEIKAFPALNSHYSMNPL
jgi:hypothetical protein